jgi:hypothetical protein
LFHHTFFFFISIFLYFSLTHVCNIKNEDFWSKTIKKYDTVLVSYTEAGICWHGEAGKNQLCRSIFILVHDEVHISCRFFPKTILILLSKGENICRWDERVLFFSSFNIFFFFLFILGPYVFDVNLLLCTNDNDEKKQNMKDKRGRKGEGRWREKKKKKKKGGGREEK